MDVERNNVIHSRGGKLGNGASSVADVQRIAASALQNGSPRGIVVHFHGGLVDRAAGLDIAKRLAPIYSQAGAYPVFFVWESGLLESLRNNLRDILSDPVFRELLKKASEWVLKESGGAITTRGGGQAVDATRLRADFDRWFAGGAQQPPLTMGPGGVAAVARAAVPDEDDLAARIEAEIETDTGFETTMAGLAVAAGRTTPTATRGAGIEPRVVPVAVDRAALDQMFPPQPPVAVRGGIPWLSVAKFIAKVVIASVKRFVRGRDHGPYVTVVEEVLRAAYLAKVGEVIWRQMKKDTADAFADGNSAGAALLAALASGHAPPTITLVGHSTGAVYINNFLGKAAAALPRVRFNIVFLAPACRFDDLAKALDTHAGSIANFRVFAMRDTLEQDDTLVPIIYPRSLLYFVSGVLEGEADMPIAGMERFLVDEATFGAEFPGVSRVRRYLAEDARRTVWAIAAGGAGLASGSRKHGDFDNDADTVASLAAIIRDGY